MLKNSDLINILAEWSFWEHKPQASIDRNIILPKNLHSDLALIIQGVRRCGKSTLLCQIPKYYNLDYKKCFYCNFEDSRLLDILDHNLLTKIITLAQEYIGDKQPCYFFFDEIQNVYGWEKWLHTQLERPKNNYYILTGSNSSLLSGEFATSLTGRHISLELYPFDYSEYKKFISKNNEKLNNNTIEKYLLDGGFPRAISYDEPVKLLQEYFKDIISRDVYKRVNARNVDAINQVLKMTYESCGSELSFRKIAAACGLSVDTVKSYLEACEQAYLIFACQYFSFSEKKRAHRQIKYYPIDPALRSAISSNTTPDLGKSLELLVYLRLKQNNEYVYYWQETNHGEVDFIAVNNNIITPYQVSLNGPKERHYKALDYFYEAYPNSQEALFITKDNADKFL